MRKKIEYFLIPFFKMLLFIKKKLSIHDNYDPLRYPNLQLL